jgi:CheY-like chemotaxis protein
MGNGGGNPDNAASTTLLIVDDDPTMLRLVHRILELEESVVIVGEAENGEQAVQMWRALHPDMIILDHMMPILSGLDAARQILDESPSQRIIMFSALAANEAWVQSVQDIGVSACLAKTDVTLLPDLVAFLR